jgi:hypothetical protein
VNYTGAVRKRLLDRIEKRPLGLIRGGIAKPRTGVTPVPEIAADEQGIAVLLDSVQNRAWRRIGRGRGLSVAKTTGDRAFVGRAVRIDSGVIAAPASFRRWQLRKIGALSDRLRSKNALAEGFLGC